MTLEQVPALTVRDEWDGGVAIVTVHGEIDMTTAGTLRDRLGSIVAKCPDRLIIDLAGVGFLDSTAVHTLAQARRALPDECPVVLRSPQSQAQRVFELTRMDSLFVIE